MHTIIRATLLALILASPAHAAKKLNTLQEVLQEQTEWCWAATTRAALLYFGVDKKQCELAEWTRTHNTANDRYFGATDCCKNPSGQCNTWNYFWMNGSPKKGVGGTIEDLLVQFGTNAKTTRYEDDPNTTANEGQRGLQDFSAAIDGGKLVFIRWAWSDGGGHFIVGYGYDGTLIHYMNPWPGEGLKIGEHSWMASGASTVNGKSKTHSWASSLEVRAEGTACAGKADGASCDDGNPCTTSDQCTSGTCGGAPVTCSSLNPCMTGATCNPANGLCGGGTKKADGTACDDGDRCTTADTCRAGACQGTATRCASAGACSQAGRCDSATGQCVDGPPKAEGMSCDDGDPCTTADSCRAGVCRGAAKSCVAEDECHTAGVCGPSTGTCSMIPRQDGSACTGGTCRAGVCRASGGDKPSPAPEVPSGCSTSGTANLSLTWSLLWLALLGWRPALAVVQQRRRG